MQASGLGIVKWKKLKQFSNEIDIFFQGKIIHGLGDTVSHKQWSTLPKLFWGRAGFIRRGNMETGHDCPGGQGFCYKASRSCFIVYSKLAKIQFSSVYSAVSDSLRPHGLQHIRLPCPSPTPGACSNSCPSSQWCQPSISSSVIPFSSCLQSFPASGSFPVSQFFSSGGQSIGASASASVLPMNIQDWFPLGRTGCISLQFKGLSRVFSNTTVQKHLFFGAVKILILASKCKNATMGQIWTK